MGSWYFINAHKLRTYKYVGTDTSISYVYLLSPLASYLVNFFPMTISANLITFAGHLMVVFMYFLTVFFCGTSFSCRLPDWSILLSSFLYMGWLILDNIDGKQARRTGTSSPLGLMFDHQVDALNVTITTSYFANLLMAPHHALLYWIVGSMPFYFTTWEENYTGSLIFPFISAASDGCLLFGILSFVFYSTTPEYYTANFAYGLCYRDWICYIMMTLATFVSIYNVVTVLRKSSKKCQAIVYGFSTYAYYLLCCWCLFWISPANLAQNAPKEVMACVGFCFAREIAYLQIAHVLDEDYVPLNWPNFFVLSSLIINSSLHYFGIFLVSEYYFLLVMLLIAFVSYVHLIKFSIKEITEELKIPVFAIQSKKYTEKNRD